jgi:hypothetical protein
MSGDDCDQDPPDLGTESPIDPFDERLHFVEDPLSRMKIEAARPFDQEKSDNGGSPMRVVVCPNGDKFIKQGDHRIYAAREDKLHSVKVLMYTPEQWEIFSEQSFDRTGSNNPRVGP